MTGPADRTAALLTEVLRTQANAARAATDTDRRLQEFRAARDRGRRVAWVAGAVAMAGLLAAVFAVVTLLGVGRQPQPTSPVPHATVSGPPTPAGRPLPSALQGFWVSVRDAQNILQLKATSYDFGGYHTSGQALVNGDQLVLFESLQCDAPLPDGVGRYDWRLVGGRLSLRMLSDPCGRKGNLAGVTFVRTTQPPGWQ
jgi:hypothetical protein